MCKPTVCQVEGCNGTYRIYRHKITGVYACAKCRNRYHRNGSFGYQNLPVKPKVCIKCGRENAREKIRADGICAYCIRYYRENGTYRRKIFKRTKMMSVTVCEHCRYRQLSRSGTCYYRGGKWLCDKCYTYYRKYGKHRPTHYDTQYCRDCQRPLERKYNGNYGGKGYCRVCYKYRRNHGKPRPQEYLQKQAPHGWCECGNPATQCVHDLQTGVLRVNPTLTGSNDTVSEQTHEYGEWMCDDCAKAEYEMRDIGGNEYRPTGLLMREAAD